MEDQDMWHKTFNNTRDRRGATAVEFALVAPVFFLFIFGMIELGRMVMIQQSMTNAAREGCRKAVLATTRDADDVDAAVRNYLQNVVADAADPTKVRVNIEPTTLNWNSVASGTEITVRTEIDYVDASWLPLGILNLNPRIGAESTQQRE